MSNQIIMDVCKGKAPEPSKAQQVPPEPIGQLTQSPPGLSAFAPAKKRPE